MKKRRLFLILTIIGAVFFLNSCIHVQWHRLRRSDQQWQKYFNKNKVSYNIKYIPVQNNRTLRVVCAGDSTLPATLLIHGSPGSSHEYDMFLNDKEILAKTYLIVADRPGYGYSEWGKLDTNLYNQASYIVEAMKQLVPTKKYMVVGNSYGGPVAALVASIDSVKVHKLMLIVSSLKAGAEKIYKISYHINKPDKKKRYPLMIQMANDEKLSHFNQLSINKNKILSVACHVCIVHGKKDELIYFENAEFARDSMKKAKSITFIPHNKAKHPMLWNQTKFVKTAFKDFIDKK